MRNNDQLDTAASEIDTAAITDNSSDADALIRRANARSLLVIAQALDYARRSR